VRACGFVFIGPTPEMIRKMGDKSVARRTMLEAGLPLVPGSAGTLADADEALSLARESGFPVIIKASAGGGGRGMRVAWDEKQLRAGFGIAQAEAGAAFGNNAVYLEKYIARPRHIEFQLFGDSHGNLIHLGERECSVQRNHQKLIEEAPSPFRPEQRRLWSRARGQGCPVDRLSQRGHDGVPVRSGRLVLLREMNTRIQVEHPVTEEVTGLDLVKEQIRVAAGERLSRLQDDRMERSRDECRSTPRTTTRFPAEPRQGHHFYKPGGPGCAWTVTSTRATGAAVLRLMIGKLIAYGKDRPEALRRMQIGLEETIIEGGRRRFRSTSSR
jgi:acetyl-CoA carboxylase biotin carboxylase subunit